ncbi:hypothetical protein J6590_021420 [Homalodisca vitripennis]|nr:hypothetical protein J6590_021420 [Homalodisca vitripennis]
MHDNVTGEFGTYQMIQFSLHILAAMTAGLHMLSIVTVAAVPAHRCAIPEIGENETKIWNDTYWGHGPEDLNLYIPPGKDGHHDSCNIMDPDTNVTSSCERWVYDTTYYKSSRGMEWNFVCEDRWKGSIAQSSYMFGVFAGAVTLGSLADSRLSEMGTFKSGKVGRSGRPRTTCTAELEEGVLDEIENHPGRSTRELAFDFGTLVYDSPVDTIEELRIRIVNGIQRIRETPGIFERVRQSMRRRLDACILNEGKHFEHLL